MMQVLYLLFIFFTCSCFGNHNISLAAIFRDDADYIQEWIEYHLLIGVEHFYLYSHLSQDHYQEVLEPYIKEGLVELIEWNHPYSSHKEWVKIQCGSYNNALKRCRQKSNWLAIIDTDEFIVPKTHTNLHDFLAEYDQYSGVVIHWQMFGDSDVKSIPPDKLMIELLNYKIPTKSKGNQYRKSIVKPLHVREMGNPHNAIYHPYRIAVNTKKQRAMLGAWPNPIDDYAQINHYWCRDKKGFKQKLEKSYIRYHKEPMKKRAVLLNNLATVEDKSIHRFIPALRKQIKNRFSNVN